MSIALHDYSLAIQFAAGDYSFRSLLWAAMAVASPKELDALKTAFPDLYAEWAQRRQYAAGILPEEEKGLQQLMEAIALDAQTGTVSPKPRLRIVKGGIR